MLETKQMLQDAFQKPGARSISISHFEGATVPPPHGTFFS